MLLEPLRCNTRLMRAARARALSTSRIAPRLVAAVAVCACLGLMATTAFAQLEPSPDDPALFDLGLAQRNLATIDSRIDGLNGELATALAELDALLVNRDFLSMNGVARADVLSSARAEARGMAVNAYIGLGPPVSRLSVLDAESASDLTYRNALLRQQTLRLLDAAGDYEILLGAADETVQALSDRIDTAKTRVARINRDLRRAEELRPPAVWTVSIAEINAIADDEYRTGRFREASREQWQKLRFCESTETYGADTGNTFYGAYQFTWETWGTVGGSGNPALAPPAEQDARARVLHSRRGAQPWPICGRFVRV